METDIGNTTDSLVKVETCMSPCIKLYIKD